MVLEFADFLIVVSLLVLGFSVSLGENLEECMVRLAVALLSPPIEAAVATGTQMLLGLLSHSLSLSQLSALFQERLYAYYVAVLSGIMLGMVLMLRRLAVWLERPPRY